MLELNECPPKLLGNVKSVEEIMVAAAKIAKATIVGVHFHQFSPFGVSGVVVIAESHVAIHTWPEYGYAAVDIFTCGDTLRSEVAAQYLVEKFQSRRPALTELKRGLISDAKPSKVLPQIMQSSKEIFPYGRPSALQVVS